MTIDLNTVYQLAFYFIIYSVAGWIMESIFRSICEKKVINSGFMYGPYCPIYGFGALIMIFLLSDFKTDITLLFIISFVVLSLWEYMVGLLLERIFHTKYWDYSKHKININGRVCLTNSVCWGILGIAFTKIIHPFVVNITSTMQENILIYVDSIFLVIMLLDSLISIINTIKIKDKVKELMEISEKMLEKVNQLKINTQNKISTNKKLINKDTDLELLQLKHNKITMALYKQLTRMKKAFPTMQSEIANKFLSQKIDINELKEKIKKIKFVRKD